MYVRCGSGLASEERRGGGVSESRRTGLQLRKRWRCPLCGQRGAGLANFARHRRVHAEDEGVRLVYCHGREALAIRAEDGLWVCDTCGEPYPHSLAL